MFSFFRSYKLVMVLVFIDYKKEFIPNVLMEKVSNNNNNEQYKGQMLK